MYIYHTVFIRKNENESGPTLFKHMLFKSRLYKQNQFGWKREKTE